jgi:hypothetical protein
LCYGTKLIVKSRYIRLEQSRIGQYSREQSSAEQVRQEQYRAGIGRDLERG